MEVLITKRGETVKFINKNTAIVFDNFNNVIEAGVPVLYLKSKGSTFIPSFNSEFIRGKGLIIGNYGLKGGGQCFSKCMYPKESSTMSQVNSKMISDVNHPIRDQSEISDQLDQLISGCNKSIIGNIVLSINFLSSLQPSDFASPINVSISLLQCLGIEGIWEQLSWAEVRKKIASLSRKLLIYSYYKSPDRVKVFSNAKNNILDLTQSIIDRILEEEDNFPENGLLYEMKAITALIKTLKDSDRWYKSLISNGKNIFDIFFSADPMALKDFISTFSDFLKTKIENRMSIHLSCLDYISKQEISLIVDFLSRLMEEFKESKWELLYSIIDEVEPVLLSKLSTKSQKELLFFGNKKSVGIKSFAGFNFYTFSDNWRIREKVVVVLVKLIAANTGLKNSAQEVIAERIIFETDRRVKDILNDPTLVEESHDLIQRSWEVKKDRFEELLIQERSILESLEKKVGESQGTEHANLLAALQAQRDNFEKQINEISQVAASLGKASNFLEKYQDMAQNIQEKFLSIQLSNQELERNIDRKFSVLMHKITARSPKSNNLELFSVPNSSNFFIGRDKELEDMNSILNKFKKKVCTLALVGMGGIGKTQLALEFANQKIDYFGPVWFMSADSRSKIEAGFFEIAEVLNINLELKQAEIFRKIFVWLSQQKKPWLLILDGLVNPKDIEDFAPHGKGMILITSRYPYWDLVITIKELDRKYSLQLLENISNIDIDESAEQLAEELADLPIAVCQAASFIMQTNSDYEEYLILLKNRQSIPRLNEPLQSSWNISLLQISEENKSCRSWLECLAFLSPNGIPENLSKAVFEYIDNTKDLMKYKQVIKLALGYSLIEVDNKKWISMHKLVQNFIRRLSKKLDFVIEVLENVFLSLFTMDQDIEIKKSLADHLKFFLSTFKSSSADSGELHTRLGIFYLEVLRNVSLASSFMHTALKIQVEKFGKSSLEAAHVYNNLGNVYFEQSDIKQAISYYQKGLSNKLRNLESNAIEIAYSYNNLGISYLELKDMQKAIEFLSKAMEIMKIHLDESDISITTIYLNLGIAYDEINKFDKAESYLNLAYNIRSKIFKPPNPDVADCLLNLGILHRKMNKKKQGLQEITQACEILNECLGSDHPSTINAKEHLEKTNEYIFPKEKVPKIIIS
jgi:tetratricopeptide (TPR) repeat protein